LLGPHSYDPGISQSLVLWTTEIPNGDVQVDLDRSEAVLHIENLCSIFDAFSVPNSFDPAHALGFVGAILKSLRIHWNGITRTMSFSNAATGFRGDYVENTSATIAVTVRTPTTTPPFTPAARNGFQFIADPATTVTHFAQIGHESNGVFFS
jgi:hypothetical protein